MAEKRRGLGRGLGSLIPSQEPGRPSDVFFPRGERSTDAVEERPEEAPKERPSSDPAESMRRAQAGRRSAATKRTTRSTAPAKKTAASVSADEAVEEPASSTQTEESGKQTGTRPTGTKTRSASTTKSTAQRATTAKTGSKTAARTGAASKPAATKKTANRSTAGKVTAGKTTTAGKTATAGKGTSEKPTAGESTGVTSDVAVSAADASVASPTAAHPAEQDTIDTSNRSELQPGSNTEPDTAPTERAEEQERAAGDATGDPRVDGVYVSRETVQTHSSSVSADDQSVPGADHLSAPDAVGADVPSTDIDDSVPADQSDPQSPVSRETPEATDDEGFDDLLPVPGTTFGEIDLDLIRPNPRQPRDVFDEDALDELITSIREIGVLQPVVVRRRPEMPGHYELIMGERRFRASKEAGKKTIPAIVRATADDDLLRDALLENLHRVDLNPLEEAAAYAQLLEDFNCTQEELSARIGRSRPQISNTIRLLKLPAMVQRRVAAGVLSSGHARALLGLTDGANMEVLAQRVVAEGLSVRATEEAVLLLNRGDRVTVSRGTRETHPELAELARSLGDRLDTRVNVVMGKRKGKLSVEFANGEDLSRILMLLGLDPSSQTE